MKQFYFGNDLKKMGYIPLAYSDDIPQNILAVMEKYVTPFSVLNRDNNKEFGLVMSERDAVFFCTALVPPRVKLGEDRPTYFSHEYYIQPQEMAGFVKNMPSVLMNTEFRPYFSESYDVSDIDMITGNNNLKAPKSIVKAGRKILNTSGHMIFYSKNMSDKTALKIMAELTSALPYEERENISFISNASSMDARLYNFRFIFTDAENFKTLRNNFYVNTAYCNLDEKSIKYTFDIVEAEKKENEKTKDENIKNSENTDDLSDKPYKDEEPDINKEDIPLIRRRKVKKRNRFLIPAAIFILVCAVIITGSLFCRLIKWMIHDDSGNDVEVTTISVTEETTSVAATDTTTETASEVTTSDALEITTEFVSEATTSDALETTTEFVPEATTSDALETTTEFVPEATTSDALETTTEAVPEATTSASLISRISAWLHRK